MNRWACLAAAALALVLAPACKTQGFCFENCDGDQGGAGGAAASGPGGSGGQIFGGSGGNLIGGSGGRGGEGGTCVMAVDGLEICNGQDDDCDGEIDEPAGITEEEPSGIDFTNPATCGTCDHNCEIDLMRVSTPICNFDDTNLEPGVDEGTCDYDECSSNWYDADGDRTNGCEYFCPFNQDGTNTDDPGYPNGCGQDDDCDGEIDEDVDTCTDTLNCGVCGNNCDFANATGACVTTAPAGGTCDDTNTDCQIESCDAGFWDIDGSPDNGCEYACTLTNGGVEICDGIDNDCDQRIDNADPDLEVDDTAVGAGCFGGTLGLCADTAHQGVQKCIAASIRCCDVDSNNANADGESGLRNGSCDVDTGPQVLKPGEQLDVCNGIDDDCDGYVDALASPDAPVACATNADCAGQGVNTVCRTNSADGQLYCSARATNEGGICGDSTGACQTGVEVCTGGTLVCTGAVGPVPETCDGLDNNCDGVIDGTRGTTPTPCTSNADCPATEPVCLPLSGDPNDKGCVDAPLDVSDGTGFLACDVPPPAPPAATRGSPCQAGVAACTGGVLQCIGSITAPQAQDECFEDTNCDGVLDNQSGLTNDDENNCGTCGNACSAQGANGDWECVAGVCNRIGCNDGFIECGGANPDDCETTCNFLQSGELCNGADDNCNCQVDEDPIVSTPTPVQVCGVSPTATDAGCTTGVALTCVPGGGWECTFPSGYCPGGDCAGTFDTCDGLDNNCDGVIDEPFVAPNRTQGFKGQACNSDDGLATKHGPCQTTGVFVCNALGNDTTCSAAKDDTQSSAETCDGVDNDCDGTVDDTNDVLANDTRVGNDCFGGTDGVCADPANAGTTTCVTGGVVECVGPNLVFPGDLDETCNSLDDDCDGVADNNLVDDGNPCGNNLGECSPGTFDCQSGTLVCVGGQQSVPETCDGLDNNCNGLIDDAPTDANVACDVPPAPPPGISQPCQAGTSACIGGSLVCQGSIVAEPGAVDECFDDTDCNGTLENQSGLANSDVLNCGACGNNCNDLDPNGNWICNAGTCELTSCKAGAIDCDADPNTCETVCTFSSSTESCNGIDDDCDCEIDEVADLATPTTVQACGVSPSASAAGCTTGVTISCVAGAWDCTFPPDFCSNATCALTPDVCDGLDNDCDGQVDEPYKYPQLTQGFIGQACNSDDGLTAKHGPCQTTGVFQCRADEGGTECSAVKDDTQATTETCDGVDNDCNGTVDEGTLGGQCFGGTTGLCADVASAGTETCVAGQPQCQGGALVEPGDVNDTCNGVDDDCDGFIDAVAPPGSLTACVTDADCSGLGIYSICATSEVDAQTYCVAPTTDEGGACESGVGSCQTGIGTCNRLTGALECTGFIGPTTETCNGLDDDCDGVIDGTVNPSGGMSCIDDAACAANAPYLFCLPNSTNANALECARGPEDIVDVGTGAALSCDEPPGSPPAPTGSCATVDFPCQAGTWACNSGVAVCENSVTAEATAVDGCCQDTNCDGTLDLATQPDTDTDPDNCGSCGNDCSENSAGDHADYVCNAGVCTFNACEPGFIDCTQPADDVCETSCVPTGVEVCNGVDDDCDCIVDNVDPGTIPTGSQVCGVRGTADPLCADGDGTADPTTGGVLVQCVGGAWTCTFPTGYCDGGTPAACSTTSDICDGKDNDCDGNADENFKTPILTDGALGDPCFSDDGLPEPGHGACQGAGIYVCDGTTSTVCNATRQDANASQELCNAIDDDCDGLVDETYLTPGTNASHVRPAVVGVDTDTSGTDDLWVFQFEASRPGATGNSPGSGNGYHCGPGECTGVPDGPAGVGLDQTLACSVGGKIPWFNVTPIEAEQTCQALGGFVCPDGDWMYSCEAETAACTWGYGTNCTVSASTTCNIHDFDFTAGGVIDDGLLPTASSRIPSCYADVGGEFLYDITGNLREITKRGADDYRLLGGAFNTHSESGATCQFDFLSVQASYQFFDTGFRCCFDADPSPGEVCGDGVCEATEDNATCATDCP